MTRVSLSQYARELPIHRRIGSLIRGRASTGTTRWSCRSGRPSLVRGIGGLLCRPPRFQELLARVGAPEVTALKHAPRSPP
jgi:hypothetical protein